MSSRSVSGTLKKLVADKFVEKIGSSSPVSYRITPIGYTFDLDKLKNS